MAVHDPPTRFAAKPRKMLLLVYFTIISVAQATYHPASNARMISE
jgi:hypothetical protein